MSLTVASLAKNEEGRFLAKALDVWGQFADRIVVIDNDSTDATPDILKDAGVEVHHEPTPMQGNEWQVRKALYEKVIGSDGFVMWLDTDQIPASDPRDVLRGPVFGFRVFDLWTEDAYRSDPWWGGHRKPWWRGIHAPDFKDFDGEWSERGWHSGHLPVNLPLDTWEMPVNVSILHYAYASPELREQKVAMYEDLADHLHPRERFHAKTIISKNPVLRPLPFEPTWSLI